MKKAASLTAAEGLRDWQDVIGQHTSDDSALSPAARRNRIVRWANWGATIFAALLVLLVAAWALRAPRTAAAAGRISPVDTPLEKLAFASDGVLTTDWVWQYLNLQKGGSLRKFDIFAARQHLLDLKQVRDVSIERELPGTLRITVKERRPWLRDAVDNGAGGYKLHLVSADGTVFEGQDYPDEVLNQLPWLAGVTLHRNQNGAGFEPVPGMEVVAEMLRATQAHLPKVAAQWTVVDLSQYDTRPEAPVSLIKVRSTDLGELKFLASDFQKPQDEEQLFQRFGFAVQSLEQKPMLLHGMDLSIGNQVVVQPVASALNSPARRAR